ncbi:TPA: hypothetical protein RVS77_002118 [Pasteurella multocida]|nr:hypothetical protein [Pasteurella multocida]
MKGFDLQRALAGEPVRLRNGKKAFVAHRLPEGVINRVSEDGCIYDFALLGYTVQMMYSDEGRKLGYRFSFEKAWKIDGRELSDGNIGDEDIVAMWNDNIVKVELPRPLEKAEVGQMVWYVSSERIDWLIYKANTTEVQMLEDARFFATREDAKAWGDLAKRVREM